MPDPPDPGLLTRYLLENPWPLAGLLLLAGLVIGGTGWRDGRGSRIATGGGLLVLAAVAIGVSRLVTTAGEHAERVTRALVAALVEEDLVAVAGHFAPEARFHIGATTNPGQDADILLANASWFAERYDVDSNRITGLGAFTESRRVGTVHLTCFTDVGSGFGRTQWHLRVEEGADGWQVTDLTWIGLNGGPPRRLGRR